MRLKAILFKEETANGLYRDHFIVYSGGVEAARFALEFTEKPSAEILADKVGSTLEQIAKSLPPQPETIVFEKEL